MKVFAIDVGGVLASKQHDGEPVPGSKEALFELADRYDLWIVSQCDRSRALKTREWLHEHEFDLLIPRDKQVYIGFDKHNKNQVLRDIGASYFIDDRWKHIQPALSLPKMDIVFHLVDVPHPVEHIIYQHAPTWADVLERMVRRDQ